MFRKTWLPAVLAGLFLMLPAAPAAEPLPAATQWVPDNAFVVLEVSQPKAVLDVAFDAKTTEMVTSLPAYQALTSRAGYKQFRAVVGLLEASLNTKWQPGVRKLLGGGITLAAGPNESVLLIVDSEDAELLSKLHEVVLGFAKGDSAAANAPAARKHRGTDIWAFGPGQVHAIVGNRFILANRPEVLEAALDLRAGDGGGALADVPAYRAARKAAGDDAVARAYVNVGVFKQVPGIQAALGEAGNPLLALLFAGITEAARESSWLSAGLKVEGDTFALSLAVDGRTDTTDGPASFAAPKNADEGALPNLVVPRRIAAVSLYRDLHGFYAAKDDLFPQRTSELIFFENMMGIFFSGLDLTEEVLGETHPEVRIVVAEQEYSAEIGTPAVQMPAFAAVFRLRRPEAFMEVVEEAWQKAIGLVNFTRGQQAEPGLIIDRPVHNGVKFTVAYFRAPKEGERTNIDSRYNFRPALAGVGEYLILSSTDDLTRDLIDAIKREQAGDTKCLAETHSAVELDGPQLLSILNANRQNMIRQNMIDKGSTQEQAENEMGMLLDVLRFLGNVKLDVGTTRGQPRAGLELGLNRP